MELQELVLRAVTIQARYRLAPRFADLRGALIEELQEQYELSEYGWGEAQIQVFNPERTKNLIVAPHEVRIVYEHIDRVDEFAKTAGTFLARSIEILGLREVGFLGVRSYWMAAVDSFDDLASWMVQRLSPDDPVSSILGGSPTDAGWVFEYHGPNPQHTARFGPMRVEQLLGQVFATSERDLFPENFLFLDLDRTYVDAAIPVDAVVERAQQSLEKSIAIGQKFGGWLATAAEG